jgi:hypothetical protein
VQLDRQIRVNELLLQREELFLRIHSVETEIERLLGGPYPFTRPPLPSDRRAKRKAGAASAPTTVAGFFASRSSPASGSKPPSPSSPPVTLRRLADDEAAYRVTYLQFNREVVETHPELGAVTTLLAAQAAHLRVLKVETIDASGAPRAVLHVADTAR